MPYRSKDRTGFSRCHRVDYATRGASKARLIGAGSFGTPEGVP